MYVAISSTSNPRKQIVLKWILNRIGGGGASTALIWLMKGVKWGALINTVMNLLVL
jgi:hypothetical protein